MCFPHYFLIDTPKFSISIFLRVTCDALEQGHRSSWDCKIETVHIFLMQDVILGNMIWLSTKTNESVLVNSCKTNNATIIVYPKIYCVTYIIEWGRLLTASLLTYFVQPQKSGHFILHSDRESVTSYSQFSPPLFIFGPLIKKTLVFLWEKHYLDPAGDLISTLG